MGYLDKILGTDCWQCKAGFIKLLDKGNGLQLACSGYPNTCQFISAGPIQCPGCEKGILNFEYSNNKRYLFDYSCGFKSEINELDLKLGKMSNSEKQEIQLIKDRGILIDFLSKLNFEELNNLWDSQVWEDPENLPITENIDALFIMKSIQELRRIKWKLKNK